MKKRIGFTLVELLVVISIIAILLAVLIPTLQRARGQAKNIVCRANIKQWGVMLSMYANANDGHFMPGFSSINGMWMLKLRPYYGGASNAARTPEGHKSSDTDKIRLCPKTTTFTSTIPGAVTNPFTAWGINGEGSLPGVQPWGEKGLYGSYGINAWVHDPPKQDGDVYRIDDDDWPYFWRTIYVKNPATIPVFGDSVWEGTLAKVTDSPPQKPGFSTMHDGMWGFCIPRHGLAVNWVFLDNSARKVPIKELWNQRWSPNFTPGKNIRWSDYPWISQNWGN